MITLTTFKPTEEADQKQQQAEQPHKNLPTVLALKILDYVDHPRVFVSCASINKHYKKILQFSPELVARSPLAATAYAIKTLKTNLTPICSFPLTEQDTLQNNKVGYDFHLWNEKSRVSIVKCQRNLDVGFTQRFLVKNLTFAEPPSSNIAIYEGISGKLVQVTPFDRKQVLDIDRAVEYGENNLAVIGGWGSIHLISITTGVAKEIMESQMRVSSSFVVGETIFIYGGGSLLNPEYRLEAFSNLHKYNPERDRWTLHKDTSNLLRKKIGCSSQRLFVLVDSKLHCYNSKSSTPEWISSVVPRNSYNYDTCIFKFSEDEQRMLLTLVSREGKVEHFICDVNTGKVIGLHVPVFQHYYHIPVSTYDSDDEQDDILLRQHYSVQLTDLKYCSFWNNHLVIAFTSIRNQSIFTLSDSKNGETIATIRTHIAPIIGLHPLKGIEGLTIGQEADETLSGCAKYFSCCTKPPGSKIVFSLLKSQIDNTKTSGD